MPTDDVTNRAVSPSEALMQPAGRRPATARLASATGCPPAPGYWCGQETMVYSELTISSQD